MTTETTQNEESVTHQEIPVIGPEEGVVFGIASHGTSGDGLNIIEFNEAEKDHDNAVEVHRNQVDAMEDPDFDGFDNVRGVMHLSHSRFNKQEATSIVRNILNKQYPFTQANAEKVLVALIENGLVTNVK